MILMRGGPRAARRAFVPASCHGRADFRVVHIVLLEGSFAVALPCPPDRCLPLLGGHAAGRLIDRTSIRIHSARTLPERIVFAPPLVDDGAHIRELPVPLRGNAARSFIAGEPWMNEAVRLAPRGTASRQYRRVTASGMRNDCSIATLSRA